MSTKISNFKNVSFEKLTKGIKTRYDDIMEEIRLEKAQKYFEQNVISPDTPTYNLGDKCGQILNKLL